MNFFIVLRKAYANWLRTNYAMLMVTAGGLNVSHQKYKKMLL